MAALLPSLAGAAVGLLAAVRVSILARPRENGGVEPLVLKKHSLGPGLGSIYLGWMATTLGAPPNCPMGLVAICDSHSEHLLLKT